PDTRRMTGTLSVASNGGDSVTVKLSNVLFTVNDAFDFIPGFVKTSFGDVNVATSVLELLERYGGSYDIPIVAKWFYRGPELVAGLDWSGLNCDDEAPDPCSDPSGYRQWLQKSHPGSSTSATSDCGSFDPNDIIGPTGYGEAGWIHESTSPQYMVQFENDPER